MIKISVIIFFSLFAMCACATKPVPEKTTEIPPEKTCYPKVIILKGVNFDYNKSVLKPGSHSVLNENIGILKSRPKMTITIIGHTDSDGDEVYNQKLSEARAKAVMQYFLEQGIPAARITAMGKGESSPIADNRTDAGKAQNRRIEIEFTDPEPGVICK